MSELSECAEFLNQYYKFNISQSALMTASNILSQYITEKDQAVTREEIINVLKPILCSSYSEYSIFENVARQYILIRFENYINDGVKALVNDEEDRYNEQIASIKNDSLPTNEDLDDYEIYKSEIEKAIIALNLTHKDEINCICKRDTPSLVTMISKGSEIVLFETKKELIKMVGYIVSEESDEEFIQYIIQCSKEFNDLEKKVSKQIEILQKEKAQTIKEIEKEASFLHRPEYIGGKNAVRLLSDVLDENLTDLTQGGIATLTTYIKQNAYKFRTKIAHHLSGGKKSINFKRTIQNSIKCEGVPIKIEYNMPKPNKVKIVSILDVSGSCINSSRVLLNFLYELQSVFKGGCESFVFVSHLAHVSDIFKTNPADIACEKAVESVPREYSNYEMAFTDFEKNYMKIIDDNTVVIFLGDARNNKNKSKKDFIKKIHDKSRKIYWLETEKREEWGEGDSVINEYREYLTNIYEIITAQDIIDFLCSRI